MPEIHSSCLPCTHIHLQVWFSRSTIQTELKWSYQVINSICVGYYKMFSTEASSTSEQSDRTAWLMTVWLGFRVNCLRSHSALPGLKHNVHRDSKAPISQWRPTFNFMDMAPSTEAWETHVSASSKREWFFLYQKLSTAKTSPLRGGAWRSSPLWCHSLWVGPVQISKADELISVIAMPR